MNKLLIVEVWNTESKVLIMNLEYSLTMNIVFTRYSMVATLTIVEPKNIFFQFTSYGTYIAKLILNGQNEIYWK